MRKFLAATIMAIMLFSTAVAELFNIGAIVTVVDEEEDIVVFEDTEGNEWVVSGSEDWLEGDIVMLYMYDNNTRKKSDDIILQYRWTGFNLRLDKPVYYPEF